jgi:large subunit ribosomal protein L4
MVNKILIKQAVLAMQANIRQSTSHTKTRGEVSGGGKKPWKQKGTGRARVGSSRSPVWVGGGITFGPTNKQNFKQALPKRMAKVAKAELWELLKSEDRVISTPRMHLVEPRTKLAVKMLGEIKPKGKTLLVTKMVEPELILAATNIPNTEVKPLDQVSILDLAYYQTLVMEKDCFDQIYGKPVSTKKITKKSEKTEKKETEEVAS